jgi:diguanylate cyclase (GGDEF)-like protein
MTTSRGGNLGFRLTIASIGVAAAAIVVTGLVVYNLSLDAVKKRQLGIVHELAELLARQAEAGAGQTQMNSLVMSFKTDKVGGTWLMTREGVLVSSPELIHSDLLGEGGGFGNLETKLLAAETAEGRWLRRPGETHVLKFNELGARYVSAFGEYELHGQKRVMGIAAVPGTDLIAGVDEPVETAYSQRREIRNYIAITCLAVGILISTFTWASLKKIIRPYYRELEEKSNEVAASNVLLSSVSGYLHSDMVFFTLTRTVTEQFNIDRARVYSYDNANRMLRFYGGPGESGPGYGVTIPLAAGGSLVSDCIANGQIIRRRVDKDSPVFERLDDEGAGAYEAVAVPIRSGEEVLGVIVVDNGQSGLRLNPEKIESIGEVSQVLAGVVARARAHERLHQKAEALAVTDTLTGLYDQNYLMSRLREELSRIRPTATGLSVLFCEVKNFKNLNADYGMKFGNCVLRAIANAIRAVARVEDVPARFGGSLFAVILPGASSDVAIGWGEMLRREVGSRGVGNSVEGLTIGLGIGVCTIEDEDISEDEVLDRCLEVLDKGGDGDGTALWTDKNSNPSGSSVG